jgi:hypothetical protein
MSDRGSAAARRQPKAAIATITIRAKRGRSRLRKLQTAGDVDSASFSPATTTVLVDNATVLKVQDSIPIGATTSRYLRVKVAAAP